MKTALISFLAVIGGWALGFWGLRSEAGESASVSLPAKSASARGATEARPWSAAKVAPALRMQGIADKAASLSAAEWPAFFRSQLDSPEATRIAARLWAENDPQGFWNWLKSDKDPVNLDLFAKDLLERWALADPEAAMAAVMLIPDKALGDRLRRATVESALGGDLAKGLALAKRAGDFNRFSWGDNRTWLKKDPATLVTALAELNGNNDYRNYLTYALPFWIEKDPAAALAWMKTAQPLKGDKWMSDGFKAVAKANPEAALAAAREITDPAFRSAALGGVLAAGKMVDHQFAEMLAELPLSELAQAGMRQPRTGANGAEFAAQGERLAMLPASSGNLMALESFVETWKASAGMEPVSEWAASLPDPMIRRRVMASIQR